MAMGEGGMVTTNDDAIAEKVRLMRSHGMTSLTLDRYKGHNYSYDVVELGYNYRNTEIQAAIGLVQLKKLPEYNKKRTESQVGTLRLVNVFYFSSLWLNWFTSRKLKTSLKDTEEITFSSYSRNL